MCVYARVQDYVSATVSVSLCSFVYMCMYVYLSACMSCKPVCAYVCLMYLCLYVCMYVFGGFRGAGSSYIGPPGPPLAALKPVPSTC